MTVFRIYCVSSETLKNKSHVAPRFSCKNGIKASLRVTDSARRKCRF
jgi:hypothetical protein